MNINENDDGSDYDILPEVGRKKQHISDSDDESSTEKAPSRRITMSPVDSEYDSMPAPRRFSATTSNPDPLDVTRSDANPPDAAPSNSTLGVSPSQSRASSNSAPSTLSPSISIPVENPFLRNPSSWKLPSTSAFSVYANQPPTLLTVAAPAPAPALVAPAPATAVEPVPSKTETQEMMPEKAITGKKKERKEKENRRWRVQGYVNQPELSAQNGGTVRGLKGPGPYNSLYRAHTKSPAPLVPSSIVKAATKGKKSTSVIRQSLPSSHAHSVHSEANRSASTATMPPSSAVPPLPVPPPNTSIHEEPQFDSYPSTDYGETRHHNHPSVPMPTPPSSSSRAASLHTITLDFSLHEQKADANRTAGRGPEYDGQTARQSVGRDITDYQYDHQSLRSTPAPTPASRSASPPAPYQAPPSPSPSARPYSPSRLRYSASATTPAPKLRMVTLLIDDRRSGFDELAEISVPLKPANDFEGGYWADAGEVCEQLQSGPSRIDGPAKVYAMRGKYRQTLMRVSANNVETTKSANLRVAKDKSLSIFVEGLASARAWTGYDNPGCLPSHPPQIMPITNTDVEMNSPSPTYVSPSQPSQPLTPFSLSSHSMQGSPRRSMSRTSSKRKRASSRDSRLSYEIPARSPAYPRCPPSHVYRSSESERKDRHSHDDNEVVEVKSGLSNPLPKKSRRDAGDGISVDAPRLERRPRHVQAAHEPVDEHAYRVRDKYQYNEPSPAVAASSIEVSPQRDNVDSSSRVRHASKNASTTIANYMRSVIKYQHGWLMYTDRRARTLSHEHAVKQCWFVQDMMHKFVGSWTPKELGEYQGRTIEPEHVAAALEVSLAWYNECRQILSLLVKFGVGGNLYEDDRVVAIAMDKTLKVSPGELPTELLNLLRAVEADWIANTAQ
ncbi:hypothetical protein EW146_g8843 [Bondarzewia mesenterica]|uniref:Uncharacterized protein n=1 Tax=Bondarzewia mesenterica TaxID=1095465 RepID=A0A4S4LBI7_9AGAM|nr:hypothetical protein EW146_g8843 [Bondarzewia mesenterica]